MGDMMVKIVISQMIKHFDFKRDKGYCPRMVQGLAYNHEEMKLKMRPRVK